MLFSDAWDKYMKDYESTALNMIESLKYKHVNEINKNLQIHTQKF